MKGQGAIIGVGAMEYPPGWQGASEEAIARNAIGKVMTLTSTYDHRVIQGAQSGDFLRRVHQLLLGEDDFYDEIFRSLRIPYEPIRWSQDIATSHDDEISKQARILELIHAYRVRGHMMADTDPLEYRQRSHPDLEVESHALTLWDLDREFATGSFGGEGRRFMKLRTILGILRDSYCRTTGIEYMHIMDPEQRRWIQQRVEQPHTKPPREEQLRILLKLNQAEAFETFLQTKFVGQKRFSLEGGETTVPLIDEICEAAAEAELDEVCIGMAHRGRLNVLANIVGKKYSQIFREFEGNIDPRTVQGSGDVKYHLGAEGEFIAGSRRQDQGVGGGEPVPPRGGRPGARGHRPRQAGRPRPGPRVPRAAAARPRRRGVRRARAWSPRPSTSRSCAGYRTGGTIHLVVNNQVGFTTSPGASRSSLYCTDVARMVQAPIFHVNGDDPEACIRVARLAFEYRQDVQQGRRHRPGLLPAPRSQRGRRPVVHAAADVRPDRAEALGPQALHRVAHRPWRHHGRGGRAGPEGLPAAARAGLHRGARGQRGGARTSGRRCPTTPRSRRRAQPRRSPRRCSSGSPTPTSRRPTASPCTRR